MLYTGNEDAEVREIVRNVYNGDWDNVPDTIALELRKRSENNLYGEIIKLFMITAAGAEGINLRTHDLFTLWNRIGNRLNKHRTRAVLKVTKICQKNYAP